MWLRDPINIELTRNSQSPIGLQFWDEASDAPLDVSDFTFSCRVSSAEGESVLAQFPCIIQDGSIGAVDILLDGRQLSGQQGTQEAITLAYQVLATSGTTVVTAMRGTIILTPGIS